MMWINKRIVVLSLISLFFAFPLFGQGQGDIKIRHNGQLYSAIVENGDTLFLAELDPISVSSLRSFDSREEYLLYLRYRRHAATVYPYAMAAVQMFRNIEVTTAEMSNRERRRYTRQMQRNLREEFEEPMKNMTKTQGYILTKMIEKELGTPMFFLIRDLRNGITATYWGTISSLFGYDLKEGYERGNDRLLDLVLDDLIIDKGYFPVISRSHSE
jgi:hypothetical protein